MKYKLDWTDMEEFKGIDLFDSFVSSWQISDAELVFEVEVSVWPQSNYYSKPIQNEYTCYKKGTIQFNHFNLIKGILPINAVKPTIDPDGSYDYGNIDYFAKTDSGYEIHGEFGEVMIKGGCFKFTIHDLLI